MNKLVKIYMLFQSWGIFTCFSFSDFSYLISSLNELEEFIKVADEGLGKTVEEGDYDQLVAVMEQLNAVHKRQDDTDMMFEPLKETIELLKTYDQEMPESVHQQIEVR